MSGAFGQTRTTQAAVDTDARSDITVVYVAYGVDELDLGWIPAETPVVVVHNDERLATPDRSGVVGIDAGGNVGFGAAVNRALSAVTTSRLVLCNPDTALAPHHFAALAAAPPDHLAAVPLVEPDGTPNSVINQYWSPAAFLATALRLGRLAPRGGRLRPLLLRALGHWGRAHRASLIGDGPATGSWPLDRRWASAAVLAVPVEPLRAVGGFDDAYFLYYEDVDLQQRLAARFPALRIHLLDVAPGLHLVGGSGGGVRGTVARHRRNAAAEYASRQPGRGWRLAGLALGARITADRLVTARLVTGLRATAGPRRRRPGGR
ncbi:MAG: hypothetical protein AAGD35_12820 [Actinomycetota bacterium]